MQALFDKPNLLGRRVTGAVLHALLAAAMLAPLTISILREFSAVESGRAVLVTLAVIVLVALFNVTLGQWSAYVRFWGDVPFLTQNLFDDSLTPREKLKVVLKSVWGRVLLMLALVWLAWCVIFWIWRIV
jgi:hypothetical protein